MWYEVLKHCLQHSIFGHIVHWYFASLRMNLLQLVHLKDDWWSTSFWSAIFCSRSLFYDLNIFCSAWSSSRAFSPHELRQSGHLGMRPDEVECFTACSAQPIWMFYPHPRLQYVRFCSSNIYSKQMQHWSLSSSPVSGFRFASSFFSSSGNLNSSSFVKRFSRARLNWYHSLF